MTSRSAVHLGLGLVLGLLVRNLMPLPASTAPGVRFSSKVLLQAAVILLGFGLDLHQVLRTGLSSLAVTLVTLGVAISGPYQQSVEAVLSPGRTMEVSGFNVTYVDLEEETSPAMTIARAVLDVTRGGKPVGRLTPERRLYRGFEQPFAEVSTLPSLGNELYATLVSATGKKAASIKISVNPLVNWVWIGGTVMCLAAFLTLRKPRGRSEPEA